MVLSRYRTLFLALLGLVLVITLGIWTSSAEEPCSYDPAAYRGLELSRLTTELEGTGMVGRMHGAAADANLFVLSVRDPDSFFKHREFSLLARDDQTRKKLGQLNRHDQICVQGRLLDNPSPQKHVELKSVQVLDHWAGLDAFPEYEHTVDLPEELKSQSSFVGKVHAIGAEGTILVMEYKDGVLPIFVQAPDLTKNLYRGDIVRLAYKIQQWPQQPTHLQLNAEAEQPMEVLDAIASLHNQPKTYSGKLVKFPQSPQLNFDVYAIEVETQGINRTFTLVNFENPEEFKNIRDKLAEIWDSHTETITTGRNMLINPEVIVEATGNINVVSTEQANPQILLKTTADFEMQAS
ncbi:hypothetical protein C1752_01652 [Acaryochloris thomasi RCC1774]|uniref:Uncharacterized protein n=1 Tax=Acaryochloris thomasi RCC1774 TaxID=1764569 RepID=A0A2W1JK48_9CYAN|nr:hypothetical protein [Acaryochloris thomasi]PZD73803.1 hypothetical protein C1752_01652 [Acaryochloris thomasi RCC1774]